MSADEPEESGLRAAALKNAESILIARQSAERALLLAKEELERKTEELQQQREWFEVTLSSIGDAVIATNALSVITFLNPVAELMTGWSSTDARGQALDQVFRIVNGHTREPVENPVSAVLRTGNVVALAHHTVLIRRDGAEMAIEDSAAPIRDVNGKILGAVMVFHDVTERRRGEAVLRANEERMRATFHQAAVGMAIADLDGRFLEANEKFSDILGYSEEEVRGLTFMDITHPDDAGPTQALVQRLLAGEIKDYSIEKRYLRKDGAVVWSHTVVTLLKGASGAARHFIGIVEDITARKQAEEALREERRILEILNATALSIAGQLDLEALVQTVTDAATQLSGAQFGAFFYNVTDEKGESLRLFTLSGAPREMFEGFGLPRNTPVFEHTFRGLGIVRSNDITHDPRYGTMAPHQGMPKGHPPVRSYLAVPVISRSGEVIGGLLFGHVQRGVFTERSERLIKGVAAQTAIAIDNARLYEAAQREIASRETAEAALRETDRRKDEFLATLAHELRNPLAPIRQAALVSKAEGATEAQKRWSHDVISRQVHHMALLLDDLLDISRITRGMLDLRTEMTELGLIVDAAVETARPAIDAKRHRFSVNLPQEPLHFAADPLRLAQVLANLLTNAAKYTDPGGEIRLHAFRAGDAIKIRVTDNGVGLSRESLDRVFAMFSQVASSQDRSEGGLGIGLSLTKGLVELHGGTIAANSPGLGRGSEFIVTLPLRTLVNPRKKDSTAPSHGKAARRRVLLADDNCDAAESLALLLQLDGHECKVVHNGQEAVAAFASFQPEIALLDIGMPQLNGYEVARHVRQGSLGRAVTLIAVTGWGQDNDKARALAAGFNHHFTKPVEPERLLELIRAEGLRK